MQVDWIEKASDRDELELESVCLYRTHGARDGGIYAQLAEAAFSGNDCGELKFCIA